VQQFRNLLDTVKLLLYAPASIRTRSLNHRRLFEIGVYWRPGFLWNQAKIPDVYKRPAFNGTMQAFNRSFRHLSWCVLYLLHVFVNGKFVINVGLIAVLSPLWSLIVEAYRAYRLTSHQLSLVTAAKLLLNASGVYLRPAFIRDPASIYWNSTSKTPGVDLFETGV
jgi:hypothetical protein